MLFEFISCIVGNPEGCQPKPSFDCVLVCALQESVTENHENSTVLYRTVHIYADTVHMSLAGLPTINRFHEFLKENGIFFLYLLQRFQKF